ncbi:MAG: hypothetical protein D6682_07100 [Zetaproteobacteria bacterium]|nr:MAG: hypothetical protein D6682_07100 [Zetaproteobacteria bacterium]
MIDIIPRDHHARGAVEAFIHRRFAECYQADVHSFMPCLLRIREDGSGALHAVAGLRPAQTDQGRQRLFVEYYLDRPVEEAIGAAYGEQVERRTIVEIGNLAENDPGGGRHAIVALTGFLTGYGFHWVVFTAVSRLANAFSRLGMEPITLATADPERLPPEERRAWGRYYENSPKVLCGRIRDGFRTLDSLQTPLSGELRSSLLVGYHIGRWWRRRDMALV